MPEVGTPEQALLQAAVVKNKLLATINFCNCICPWSVASIIGSLVISSVYQALPQLQNVPERTGEEVLI